MFLKYREELGNAMTSDHAGGTRARILVLLPRRGRAPAVYRLTDAGLETFPRHYDQVAREALVFLKDRDAAALSQFLAWRNERLGGGGDARGGRGGLDRARR